MSVDRLDKLSLRMHQALKKRDYSRAEDLAEELVKGIESVGMNGSFVADAYSQWAKLAKQRKDHEKEIAILERYIHHLDHEPQYRYECDMLDRLQGARDKLRRNVPDRGSCEMCEKPNRVLTRIDSGHLVCSVCLREFMPQEKQEKLPTYYRRMWSTLGLHVPENPTAQEISQLKEIAIRRQLGLSDDATTADIEERIRPKAKEFRTKIVGVSHLNSDGRSRQEIVKRCTVGEQLQLVREPMNAYDTRAVQVCRMNGEQLGYLGAHIVGNEQGIGWCVADDLDAGSESQVVVSSISGVDGSRGVNIHVMIGVPPIE